MVAEILYLVVQRTAYLFILRVIQRLNQIVSRH